MYTFKLGDSVRVISCVGGNTQTAVMKVGYVGEITEIKNNRVRLDNKTGGWIDVIDIVLATQEEQPPYIRYFNGTKSPAFREAVRKIDERNKNKYKMYTEEVQTDNKSDELNDIWETDEGIYGQRVIIPMDDEPGLHLFVALKEYVWYQIDPYWEEMSKEEWYKRANELMELSAKERLESENSSSNSHVCDGSGDTLTCGKCGKYYCTCCGCSCSL